MTFYFQAFLCIAMLIFLLCMVAFAIYNFSNAEKRISSNFQKAEKQWFDTKTKFGRMQLEWARRRAENKSTLIEQKIGSLALAFVCIVIFIFLLLNLIHNGFPKQLIDQRF